MRIVLLLTILLVSGPTLGDESDVRAAVTGLFPAATDIDIQRSPLRGIFEVLIGTQVFYVSEDGAHVLGGPLLAADTGQNLTEARVADARRTMLSDPAVVRPFTWKAADTRHRITVVTDIDCPYCRRLHKDIPELNAAGFDVAYVMLPRSGRNTPSYHKTVGAACADDPEAAITAAMNGASFEAAECAHPIDDHMATARALGVSSTPSIILEDGRLVLGQKSPAALLELLED